MPNTDHIEPEALAAAILQNGSVEPQFVWVLVYLDPTERGTDAFCGSSTWATKELALDGFYNSAIEEQTTEYTEALAEGYEDAEELNPNDAEWTEQLARTRDELGQNGEAYDPNRDQVVRLWPAPVWTTA